MIVIKVSMMAVAVYMNEGCGPRPPITQAETLGSEIPLGKLGVMGFLMGTRGSYPDEVCVCGAEAVGMPSPALCLAWFVISLGLLWVEKNPLVSRCLVFISRYITQG